MRRLTLATAAAVGASLLAGAHAQIILCADCLTARVWSTRASTFPETKALNERRPGTLDLGLAFSGGGTRSASATLGYLRAIVQNGWMDKVKYIAAVSGGAWAAIPYTYTTAADIELLGSITAPGMLKLDAVSHNPDGRMAAFLGAKTLPAASFREAAWHLVPSEGENDKTKFIREGLDYLLSRREGQRGEKTYSRFIGDIFIDPIIDPVGKQASRRMFGWDDPSVDDAVADNPGKLSHIQFLTTQARLRPYLIIGATVVSTRDLYGYPLLMPIEYTPIYSGIRHRFGEKFGGTYVSSWAYDRMPAAAATESTMAVHQQRDRNFTIADVAASTGAAPQLAVLLGKTYDALPAWARGASGAIADFFPSFHGVTVHDDNGVRVSPLVPHGDGGFTDNLGLMPLLARGVKNVIVFLNVTNEYDVNDDLASYFEKVPNPGPTGNKSINVVFEARNLSTVRSAFDDAVAAKRPLVFCSDPKQPWRVRANPFYEIAPYDGLNICWVYTHAVPAWSKQITDPGLQKLLASKAFTSFPWYDTFKELKLDIAHVNLLADLSSWVMTDIEVTKRIRASIQGLPEQNYDR